MKWHGLETGHSLMTGSGLTNGAAGSSGLSWRVWVGVKATEFAGDLERGVVGWEIPFRFGVGAEGVERIDGEDLLREDVAELGGGQVRDSLERR